MQTYTVSNPKHIGYSPYYFTPAGAVSPARQRRDSILAVNRDLAGRLGLDPRFTISSNIAAIVSRVTGMEFTTAKRLFHGGVAGFVATVLSLFGAGAFAVIAAGASCWAWLESFDSSTSLR